MLNLELDWACFVDEHGLAGGRGSLVNTVDRWTWFGGRRSNKDVLSIDPYRRWIDFYSSANLFSNVHIPDRDPWPICTKCRVPTKPNTRPTRSTTTDRCHHNPEQNRRHLPTASWETIRIRFKYALRFVWNITNGTIAKFTLEYAQVISCVISHCIQGKSGWWLEGPPVAVIAPIWESAKIRLGLVMVNSQYDTYLLAIANLLRDRE